MSFLIEQIGFTGIAILSSFFAAIATILARTLLKEIKTRDIIGINFLTMGAILVLLSPLFYKFEPSILSMGILVGMALIDTVANFFYFKTFEKTEASVAAPILSLAPAFTFVFGWFLLGDSVGITTFILALLIVVCVIIFSSDFKNFRSDIVFKDTIVPAIISSLLFGASAIPAKYLLTNLGVINSPTLYMFRAGYIALFSLLLFGFSVREITVKQYRVIFVRGLVVIAQWILLYFALSVGNAGVTVTLANITPIFVFILGIFFLREKITIKKVLAALCILVLSLII